MPRSNAIVGLDIGSSKVAAIVAEVNSDGLVNILGVGNSSTGGLRRGVVVDLERTSRSIEDAVGQAERMSGITATSAFVGLTGVHLASQHNRGVVAVAREDKEIMPEDVERVLQAVRVIPMPAERRILHLIPKEFIVDGYQGIIDPVGMLGSRLEVEAVLVTGAINGIQNMVRCVERAGLEVAQMVLNPLAAAEAVLLPAEKELGAAVVDIGAGTTELAVFERGNLCFTSVLPIGGEYVTSDLAVGLRAPLSQVEEIKISYGCTIPSLVSEERMIEITVLGSKEPRRIPRRVVAEIIEPRVQEFLVMIKAELQRSGYKGMLPGGVVLTGGCSALEGLTEFAAMELDMPVRLGSPVGVGGMTDMIAGPRYATSIGLVLYASKRLAYLQAAPTSEKTLFISKIWSRIKTWFEEVF